MNPDSMNIKPRVKPNSTQSKSKDHFTIMTLSEHKETRVINSFLYTQDNVFTCMLQNTLMMHIFLENISFVSIYNYTKPPLPFLISHFPSEIVTNLKSN